MTTEASVEDRKRVQGMGNNSRGGSGSTTDPVDWQQQWCVDFPCYRVANSNTVLYQSCYCIVFIFFIRLFPPRSQQVILSVLKSYKKVLYQVYTNLLYVPRTYRRLKNLRVLIINKDERKSFESKNRNEILVWSWNNSVTLSVEWPTLPCQCGCSLHWNEAKGNNKVGIKLYGLVVLGVFVVSNLSWFHVIGV